MTAITLNVNDGEWTVDASLEMPLLWVLRDMLGLTGTKYSCGIGLCGTCTVHLDGEAVRSCVTPVSAAAEKVITTIEGLSSDGKHAVQQAWIAENVAQCGYRQPGQIMAAALLAKNPRPMERWPKPRLPCRFPPSGKCSSRIPRIFASLAPG